MGGGFSNKFRKFCRFFLGWPNWFFELSQITMKILKKNKAKKTVFRHFLENFDQKIALVYFRKILGSVSQKMISQNSTKGDTLGRHGGGGRPPINPPLIQRILVNSICSRFAQFFC